MARKIQDIADEFSLGQLRELLAIKEKMVVLEKNRDKLRRDLTIVEDKLDQFGSLIGSIGSVPRASGKRRSGKTAARVVKRRKSGVGAGAQTLEAVVVNLLAAKKSPMAFQEILVAIKKGKLYKSRSTNFANVLRRTISTAKGIKRFARGIYGLQGMKAIAPVKTIKKGNAGKAVVKTREKGSGKKVATGKVPTRKKIAEKQTLEKVVAGLIENRGGAMEFKEILAVIQKRKLVKSRSKNFANVLRRTISVSKLFKREGRGIYNLK